MNNLENIAHFGEIVGAVAVVISLIYLAIQVRQNTKAQRTENFSRALDRVAAMQATLSRDSEAAGLISKGVADASSLAPTERIQFTWAMYEFFGAFEFMFLAAKSKEIPDEVWERWSAGVAFWLAFPGVRTWWEARPIPFTDSFTRFVEGTVRDNPAPTESFHRYQAFIRGEIAER